MTCPRSLGRVWNAVELPKHALQPLQVTQLGVRVRMGPRQSQPHAEPRSHCQAAKASMSPPTPVSWALALAPLAIQIALWVHSRASQDPYLANFPLPPARPPDIAYVPRTGQACQDRQRVGGRHAWDVKLGGPLGHGLLPAPPAPKGRRL